MRILGIDPGSRLTGFGIIHVQKQSHNYIVSGCIRTTTQEFSTRLYEIFTNLNQIIQTYQPQQVAIEQVFMHKNANSALKLGQARGAAIVAVMQAGLPLFEYTPTYIKQAIVGHGHAEKEQIQQMVKYLLQLPAAPAADAADALAIAICHAHCYPLTLLQNKKI